MMVSRTARVSDSRVNIRAKTIAPGRLTDRSQSGAESWITGTVGGLVYCRPAEGSASPAEAQARRRLSVASRTAMVVWRSVAVVRSADFRPAMSAGPAPAATARPTRGESPRRRRRRVAGTLSQPPWRRLVNPYRPVEVLRPEQLDAIHDAAMRILESTGLEFMSDEALAILAAGGAEVDRGSKRVRF